MRTGKAFLSQGAGLALLAFGTLACGGPSKKFTEPMVLGGKKVSARRLTAGAEAYSVYCAACHGLAGDGKGPAAIGLRPPPRDFRQGKFKFAAVSSGKLPNDADLLRIVQNGLHGTAMLPWKDVSEKQLLDIVQYIKTLSPRWLENTPGEPIVPAPDTWGRARQEEARVRGMKVYHGFAQCLSCHPAYEKKETIEAASLELSKREATLRPDPYHSELKESDYSVKVMPPDFTKDLVRSGEELTDIYRTIASGIGGTAMPTWKGALPDEDIWAMSYYVKSLIQLRGTPEADRLREELVKALAAPAPAAGAPAEKTTVNEAVRSAVSHVASLETK